MSKNDPTGAASLPDNATVDAYTNAVLYFPKSLLGIDIFPDQHLSDILMGW